MYRGKQMNILLDNRSGTPIYMQICEQIRSQIADGTVQPDEALPSIRSLAKDLRISVITTKRAYEELEREGYIYTVAGKGCFAAELNQELLKEEKLVFIEGLMNQICEAAVSCGLQKEEVEEMWKNIWEDSNK
jgi:GntR family transcriptional regulator